MDQKRRMTKPAVLLMVLVVMLTMASGSVLALGINDAHNNSQEAPAQSSNAAITAVMAIEIALEKVGGGFVIECELDYENGKLVYEVEIVHNGKRYIVDVDVYESVITYYKEKNLWTGNNAYITGSHGYDDD